MPQNEISGISQLVIGVGRQAASIRLHRQAIIYAIESRLQNLNSTKMQEDYFCDQLPQIRKRAQKSGLLLPQDQSDL